MKKFKLLFAVLMITGIGALSFESQASPCFRGAYWPGEGCQCSGTGDDCDFCPFGV